MFQYLQRIGRSVLAVLTLCFLSQIVTMAQSAQPQRTPGALSMGSSLTFAAAFPIVKDEPYTANVFMQDVRTNPDGKRTIHEAFNIHMRDSSGRVRDEQLATPRDADGGFTQGRVQVIDPVSMQDVQWSENTKTVYTSPIPASYASYQRRPILDCHPGNAPDGQVAYENLGERTIEGIRAEGCRMTRTLPAKPGSEQPDLSVTEIWASPELEISLLTTVRYADGTERLTRLTNIRRDEPAHTLFQVPEGYKNPDEIRESIRASLLNNNPNNAKIWDYGRIEWHGDTARLVAGSSRPLNFVAMTLSTCLGVSVSSEDPHYRYLDDLLDVTAPQWAAQHPEHHAYAAKPGKVDITFNVTSDGSPTDLPKLMQEAVQQVNQQQPYGYQVYESGSQDHPAFTFIPTASHNEKGVLEQIPAYLDQKITIPPQTAHVADFAALMSRQLSDEAGQHFSCCQAFVVGHLWGMESINYQATDRPARTVLADLIGATGDGQSYNASCQPMDNRFCFITVHANVNRKPATAPQRGMCTALGYDGYAPGGS